MGTDVSGIARTVLQASANMKIKAAEKESEQDLTVSFMDLVNQNTLSSNVNVSTGSNDLEFATDTENSTKNVYDACSKPTKSVSVKEEATPEKVQSEAAKPIEEYEEEIRKILKEELGVTDEQISTAMENLGMSALDFRNLQNLSTLIQTLTGEDVGTLFLSDSFQTIMEQVSVLTDELCAELGVTREELNSLCQAWEQMQQPETKQPETKQPEINVINNTVNADAVEDVQTVDNMETKETESVTEDIVNVTDDSVEVEIKSPDTNLQEEPTEKVVVQSKEEESKLDAPVDEEKETVEQVKIMEQASTDTEEEGSFFEHSKNAKSDASVNSGVYVAGQQAIGHEEFAIPQENVTPYTSQVDTMDLIQQIAKNVRVTISATTTSMEMQLNPENLGKIYLNVSEREGVVRAQIATQTEVVKEALETQLVELRQTLNQQGVKVDAIEVTVATHEFEQNLEGNTKQEEQMQKQMEESQKQTRRNLNLDELDSISGLMTEEEQLVAQIMRDNGNQVDLTA